MSKIIKKILYTFFGVLVILFILGAIVYFFRNNVIKNHIETYVSSKVAEDFKLNGLDIMPAKNKIILSSGNIYKENILYISAEGVNASLTSDAEKTIIFSNKLNINKISINIYNNNINKTLITPDIIKKIQINDNSSYKFLIKNIIIDDLTVNWLGKNNEFVKAKTFKNVVIDEITTINQINNFIKKYASQN